MLQLRARIQGGENKPPSEVVNEKREVQEKATVQATKKQETKTEDRDKKNVLQEMIERYLAVRDMRIRTDKMAKEMKEKEGELEEELWNTMQAWGFKSISTEDNGTISRSFSRLFVINNFHLFREWANREEQYDLLREEAHRRNLRDYCSTLIKQGSPDAIPPGVEMLVRNAIHIRGRKGMEDDAEVE